MALRGAKAQDENPRLKLLLSGGAGVGKTTAALQMPRPYVMDCESGTIHYGEMIEQAGGCAFAPVDYHDLVKEIRTLMTEDHEYRTLVIDPVTTVFATLVDEGEKHVGTEFGRHYGYANNHFKRLCNLLTSIDMNVVITAHEKKEYGEDMKVVGKTFDGYKKLDYIFDLWLQLDRDRETRQRFAYVAKTRLAEFPDGEHFEFTTDNLLSRWGERLNNKAGTTELASPEQVERLEFLIAKITDEKLKKNVDKALKGVVEMADLSAERADKAIKYIESHNAIN